MLGSRGPQESPCIFGWRPGGPEGYLVGPTLSLYSSVRQPRPSVRAWCWHSGFLGAGQVAGSFLNHCSSLDSFSELFSQAGPLALTSIGEWILLGSWAMSQTHGVTEGQPSGQEDFLREPT